jgi:hypothetical protein
MTGDRKHGLAVYLGDWFEKNRDAVPRYYLSFAAMDTTDSLIAALMKAGIPSDNHQFIRRLTETVGISGYRVVMGANSDSYVAAMRRDGLPDLRIYWGFTTGFTTEEEARRIGVGSDTIRLSSKLKGKWFISHPLHGPVDERGQRSDSKGRKAERCPRCEIWELSISGKCPECDDD